MSKTVKLTRDWRYSLNGLTVLTGKAGDVLELPDHLLVAALEGGAQETKQLPPPAQTKEAAADEAEEDEEETGDEPGNEGKTVPPAVVPKRKRNR